MSLKSFSIYIVKFFELYTGADPGFQVRGGGRT